MSQDSTAHKMLVQRYADGRPICNCGMAYYTCIKYNPPRFFSSGCTPTEHWGCIYGCESNVDEARHEVAWRAAKELGLISEDEAVPLFHSQSAWRRKEENGRLVGFTKV